MNQALFLISLQHELSMSIGADLNLSKMLKAFLKICLSRIHLSSCHVYLYQGGEANLKQRRHTDQHQLTHYMSEPKRHEGTLWQEHIQLKQIETHLKQNLEQDFLHIQFGHDYFYIFKLGQQGFLIWRSRYVIDEDVIHCIFPIVDKLSTNCYAAIVHDELLKEVSVRKAVEKQIDHQARHDGLTNLYNRDYIKQLISAAYFNALNSQELAVVVFIDLNKFKPINDTMGHAEGDKLLVEVANRLLNLANNKVHIGRFGGDEFVILLDSLMADSAKLQVAAFIENLNRQFNPSIKIQQNTYNMSASIGYCLFPSNGVRSADDAIKFADIAMYEAKRAKLTSGLEYQAYMSENLAKKEAFIRDMKLALVNREFSLYYQPQYNDLGQIIGAEALLRWQDPKRGVNSPEVYIAIAEENSLIIEIGDWVIKQACHDIKKLTQLNLPKSLQKIAINVSPKQLTQADFSQKLLAEIKCSGIPPHFLSLEITENLLIESFKNIIPVMTELNAIGIDCSIDDFGTGYSSLTYLKRIPANLIKIDRSFVRDIHQNSESIAIANMIIVLGKSFNMSVLAEGVETQAELDCLKQLGYTQFQGFYFNHPMSFDSFALLLKNQNECSTPHSTALLNED